MDLSKRCNKDGYRTDMDMDTNATYTICYKWLRLCKLKLQVTNQDPFGTNFQILVCVCNGMKSGEDKKIFLVLSNKSRVRSGVVCELI